MEGSLELEFSLQMQVGLAPVLQMGHDSVKFSMEAQFLPSVTGRLTGPR